ncbi:MAG: acyltransferase [Oscillospiraceae bacterium]|jgi:surface polysaccharide O-acyltransferase-like enzyme|nr:acyltransferase [Oscillospiraceae bacterium]
MSVNAAVGDIIKPSKPREVWIDALRVLAFFLVIVNHTNSQIFIAYPPSLTWLASLTYFFISKPAVGIFIMISGANLLGRGKTIRQSLTAAGKIAIVLLVFAFLYKFMFGLEEPATSASDYVKFFTLDVLAGNTYKHLWYLYSYIALLLLLPALDRLNDARLLKYIVPITIIPSGIIPIISHYVNGFGVSGNTTGTLLPIFVGLFLCGYLIKNMKKVRVWPYVITYVALLAFQVTATYFEYKAKNGTGYLYLDNNRLFTITGGAVCIFGIVHYLHTKVTLPPKVGRVINQIGRYTFAAYLMHIFVIRKFDFILQFLNGHMHVLFAMLLFEIFVFALSIVLGALLKHIPFVKRFL